MTKLATFFLLASLIGCQTSKTNQPKLDIMRDHSVKVDSETILKKTLGSNENPVRVKGVEGQVNYLSRLRCENDNQVSYRRSGNVGVGPWGYIVDRYQVTCSVNEELIEYAIYLDMYHPKHTETQGVFGLRLSENDPSNDEANSADDLFCQKYHCRGKTTIKLKTEEGDFNQEFEQFAPVVTDLTLSILPGETLFIESEINNKKFTEFKHQQTNMNPDKTLKLNFEQMKDSVGMMLQLTNPTAHRVKFHMLLMDFKGEFHETSSCPVMAGSSIFEMWPHPILQLILIEPEILKESDNMSCVY